MRQRVWDFIKFFDWKFFVWMTVFGLVVLAGYDKYTLEQDRTAKSLRIDRLIEVADAREGEASRERQKLLDGQAELQKNYSEIVLWQKAILQWVNASGTQLPDELLNFRFEGSDDSDDSSLDRQNRTDRESDPKAGGRSDATGNSGDTRERRSRGRSQGAG